MARIRHIDIRHFRGIRHLSWHPSPGINCLIGPGDSGKSSVLEAIDYCLGTRRTLQLSDADFHGVDVDTPISISITLGELDDELKSMETYGSYLRSYDPARNTIGDEPESGRETVLTVNLKVGGDLDPVWTLVSERAEAQGLAARFLTWADRNRISPTRIGALPDHNLAWRRGSVLNRLSNERADTSAALAKAARAARVAFGDLAEEQLGETLKIVGETARELGIGVDGPLKAMLDAHAVSFGGGTIALHTGDGVPLRALGIGSTRLLLAGLQRKAAASATIVLVDELEYGLEPHRIIRLLSSLGAKEQVAPLQAFLTTHSPVVLRELSGEQLLLLRRRECVHEARRVGTGDGVQGALRAFPEAFLAPSVLVCEGASEVGLLRGLDQYIVTRGKPSLTAHGVALVDAGGCDRIHGRAAAFQSLEYRVAVLRDDDKQPGPDAEAGFLAAGGALFHWQAGQALEDALFAAVSSSALRQLIERAISFRGEDHVAANIQSVSRNTATLKECRVCDDAEIRRLLGEAARRGEWFKTVSRMEEVDGLIRLPHPGRHGLFHDTGQWCRVLDGFYRLQPVAAI